MICHLFGLLFSTVLFTGRTGGVAHVTTGAGRTVVWPPPAAAGETNGVNGGVSTAAGKTFHSESLKVSYHT